MKVINKKGLTLIEIIVAIVIFGIVAAMTFSLFQFALRSFSIGISQYNTQSEIRTVSSYILDKVQFSTSIELVSKPANPEAPVNLDTNYNYIYIHNKQMIHYVTDGTSHSRVTLGSNIDGYSMVIVDNTLNISLSGVEKNQDFVIASEVDLPNLRFLNRNVASAAGEMIKYVSAPQHEISLGNFIITVEEMPMYFKGEPQSREISYSILPALVGHTATYTSQNPSVATVNVNGAVTPITSGTTVIEMVISKDDIIMNVDIPVFVLTEEISVEIKPQGLTQIPALTTFDFDLEVTSIAPGDSVTNVIWSIEDNTVASIDSTTGVVTALITGADRSTFVNVEVHTTFGGFNTDRVELKVLPALKLATPKLTVTGNGANRRIYITEGTPGALADLYTKQGSHAPVVNTSLILDDDGKAESEWINNFYMLILRKDGHLDSDPVYY